MTEAECTTRKWGNSIGVIIPKDIVEEEHIEENEKICITIKKKHKAKEFFGMLAGQWKKPAQQLKDEMRKGWQ
ncbi:AbrB/MazE/SpoVT family DNA-binding domain-containing protein [Candidatus Woesearchaeota archaeon]|nr:AbrB/MazE/SpoVT family DNA-binding domain-containing protein [Candidatus Woesearchaeota archaeon]